MIWSVAWRNIWRNKLRSAVIMMAIAIGIFASVFTWAFYRGMVDQRIQTAILTEASHIQVHHPDYLVNPDQKSRIIGINTLVSGIDTIKGVKAVTKRILVNAMATSAETGSGVRIIGIDPEREKQVTNLYSKIKEGTYLEGGKRNPIVIGSELAEKLSVGLRTKVVLTLQSMDGTLTSGLFRVSGIYRTSNSAYDEMNVFVKYGNIAGLIGLDSLSGHEVAVLLADNDELDDIAGMIKKQNTGLDTKTWREIMPEVSMVEETMDISMYIFIGVVLVALIFGIINTMLMAILERVKELGMLMAVGMNKMRVFLMILLETVLLSITGGIIGMLAGYFVTVLFYHKGINLSMFAEAYGKLGYETWIYPVPDLDIDLKVALMVLITGILAALYPAWKAIQLKPAEALRMDV
jgi:ABC-type lipoprotein release transport system permease subunit